VESREPDVVGLRLPSWEEVISREYHPWDRDHILIDTANRSLEQNIKTLREALSRR
jgi:hypothetical protein